MSQQSNIWLPYLSYALMTILFISVVSFFSGFMELEQPPTQIPCKGGKGGESLRTPEEAGITLYGNNAYMTASSDMGVGALLCEEASLTGGRISCYRVFCELSAGSVCEVPSASGKRYNHIYSQCLHAAATRQFSNWMNQNRQKGYNNVQYRDWSNLNTRTWFDYCRCNFYSVLG